MTTSNLAICFAPNIFQTFEQDLLESIQHAPILLSLTKTLIEEHHYLFSENKKEEDEDRRESRESRGLMERKEWMVLKEANDFIVKYSNSNTFPHSSFTLLNIEPHIDLFIQHCQR